MSQVEDSDPDLGSWVIGVGVMVEREVVVEQVELVGLLGFRQIPP